MVARQRPTWMVAVTAVAVAAGVGLAVFAVDRMHEAEVAQAARARADADVVQAQATAASALAKLDAMQRDVDALDARVAEGERVLEAARTEADRRHAQALLDEANRKAREARDRLERQRREREHQQRLGGIHLDDCAKNNVLCPQH